MKVDLERFEELREQRLLKKQDHPSLPLSIWNYSDEAQYARHWEEATLVSRGLILEGDEIIGRGWRKFFNWGQPEAPEPPDLPFEVYDKLDGSLLILCSYKGLPVLASKGSFNSWHRDRGLEIILDQYPDMLNLIEEGKSYLFDLIHPENQIVVDYKGINDIYQLSVLDNETGLDLPVENLGPPHAESLSGINALENLPSRSNTEGYVVRFSDGTRLKIKEDEYVNLHVAKFQTNEKSIWRMLKEGKSREEIEESLLASLPDERHQWAKDTLEALTNDFEAIRGKVISEYSRIQEELGDLDRKAYAEEIKKRDDIKHLLFMHMSDKDFTEAIWRDLEPKMS